MVENVALIVIDLQSGLKKIINKKFGEILLEYEAKKHKNIHILIKHGPSAFTKSNYGLEQGLKAHKIKKLFITGVITSNGVFKTAQDGFKSGFEVSVIADACSDRHEKSMRKHWMSRLVSFVK